MSRAKWTSQETRALIDERKNRNQVNILISLYIFFSYKLISKYILFFQEYHDIEGTSRAAFWESVAANVNRSCGSSYTGTQCQRKFSALVGNYDVSK